ncbi:hypothetical protein BG841_09945 [Marinobacter sp. X15-166B]|nr:hypothetical protein BG841_09945 [Marinobacter sp. X15-166B]
MYPDITININLAGDVVKTATVAEDLRALGPPPEEGMARAGRVEGQDAIDPGVPPGPAEAARGGAGKPAMQAAPARGSFFRTLRSVHRRTISVVSHRGLKQRMRRRCPMPKTPPPLRNLAPKAARQ